MRQRAALAALGLTFGVLALREVTTFAYATYSKWPSSTVNFFVNPHNADISDDAAESALVAGAAVWTSQSNANFRFVYAGRVADTTTQNDGRNVVLFRNTTKPDGNAIASTYSWWSGSTLVDSDIIFWDGGFRFFAGFGCHGLEGYGAYIEDIAAHEFGHALGLGHSSVAGATMYSGYPMCSEASRTLEADDIAGVEYLYPPSSNTNTAPSVAISSPANGTSTVEGSAVTFSGSASDREDGNIGSRLMWTSSLNGQLGVGTSFAKALSAGNHVITASVTDSNGVTASKQVSVTVSPAANSAPSVVITAPANNSSWPQGTVVTFSGSATDREDGNLGTRLAWTSNVDGPIGTGTSISRSLSAGTHIVRASVTDSGGSTSASETAVLVVAVNAAPTVTISSPTKGYTVPESNPVTFTGSAIDTQDGNISARIVWSSNLSGPLGMGANITKALPAGLHTISAAVTDAAGDTAVSQVTLSVTQVSGNPPPSSLQLSGRGYKVKGEQRADLQWSGATSGTVDVYRNGIRVLTTANTGAATDFINGRGNGRYEYKLCEAGTASCSNTILVTFQ